MPRYLPLIRIELLEQLPANWEVHVSTFGCWWNVPKLTGMCYLDDKNRFRDPSGHPTRITILGLFLSIMKEHPEYYGKHGLLAAMAAFNGNVYDENMKVIAFDNWDKYNELIDEHIAYLGKSSGLPGNLPHSDRGPGLN